MEEFTVLAFHDGKGIMYSLREGKQDRLIGGHEIPSEFDIQKQGQIRKGLYATRSLGGEDLRQKYLSQQHQRVPEDAKFDIWELELLEVFKPRP